MTTRTASPARPAKGTRFETPDAGTWVVTSVRKKSFGGTGGQVHVFATTADSYDEGSTTGLFSWPLEEWHTMTV